MATARRWYFYGVAFISQLMLFGGVIGLLRGLFAFRGVGTSNRAEYIALILVGLPVYLLHWWLAQRAVQQGSDERGATLRKVYFYGVQAVTTFFALDALRNLISQGIGGFAPAGDIASHAAVLVSSILFWGYHVWLARVDSAREPEVGGGATVRRWYQYGLAAVGLVLATKGVHDIVLRLVTLATGNSGVGDFAQRVLFDSIALLVVGMVAWLPVWLRLQQRVAHDNGEQRSVLRKFYLYIAVFAGAAFALFSFAAWLQAFLKILFGEAAPPAAVLTEGTTNSLVTSLLGALVWAYHAWALNADARLFAEAPPFVGAHSVGAHGRAPLPVEVPRPEHVEGSRQASIRRLYFYLVAGVSLTALLTGIAMIGTTLARLLLGSPGVSAPGAFWREPLAWGIAAVLVGLPVWLRAWRRVQGVALADDDAGRDERRATLRKIYLYGVALVSAVIVLVNLASSAYQLLRSVLGESSLIVYDLAGAAINVLVVGVAWAYHLSAIRRDNSLAAPALRLPSDTPLTIAIGGSAEFGAAIAQRVQQALPTAQVSLLDGSPERDVLLARAQLVVLPATAWLRDAGLASALDRTTAQVLLVPLADERLSVLGQGNTPSMEQAVEGVVRWVKGRFVN